ncbi:hypothetical protein Tco_1500025 [Tanacetum coccineum]
MLEKKITSPEFAKLRHHDAVSLCLLALLECVLLGQKPRHNVPDWCLRNANIKRWPALYAPPVEQVDKTPKYTLAGFTWAFKGALPIRRLTPDAIAARSDWWVSSRGFFDGLIREPPRIPLPVNPLMCRVPDRVEFRVILMDTAYGRRGIRRIRNCYYAFSYEELELIRRISFLGYGVLVRIE